MSSCTSKPCIKLVQGDVILRQINNLPKIGDMVKLVSNEQGDKILQMSEITGNHHHFKPDANVLIYQHVLSSARPKEKTITVNEKKFIQVNSESVLYHGKDFTYTHKGTVTGDHNALVVPPGIYEIDIVREYDYDFNEVRRVAD